VPASAPPTVVLDEVTYGIGAVVDVEQRALRALEQHLLALLAQLVQDAGDVVLHRLDVLAEGQRLVEHLLVVDRARPSRYFVSTKLW
jgi:hypothetical protein